MVTFHFDEEFKIYYVIHENGVRCGDLFQKEDGYYDWWPPKSNGGCWPSYILRQIADKLDELNKPWDDEINKYFEENPVV